MPAGINVLSAVDADLSFVSSLILSFLASEDPSSSLLLLTYTTTASIRGSSDGASSRFSV